jgi:hypothetical protein
MEQHWGYNALQTIFSEGIEKGAANCFSCPLGYSVPQKGHIVVTSRHLKHRKPSARLCSLD